MAASVLLIGLAPSAVDFSKGPSLTPDALERASDQVVSELRDAGFAVHLCLLPDVEDAHASTLAALRESDPNIVSIGAGVRTDPDHLELFQELINLVCEHAPQARLAFNSSPADTVRAIRRALGS